MWAHDTARKSWTFTTRKDVRFHDGTPWSPAGGSIVFPDDRPIEQILRELAGARNAITMRGADGTLLGTGPYRIAKWDAAKAAMLAAHDSYWGGRPFLDSISIQMSRSLAEQSNDLQIGKADVTEITLRDLRAAKQKGTLTSETPPMETLALVFENGRVPPNVRQALALAIDRAAIHNVLLQRQGEVSGALLPRWLSGYAFLFPAERDVNKAKQLAQQAAPVSFVYDRDDPMIRPIGERIAVNAGEAGIILRPGGNDVRLMRLPITSGDPWLALQDLARVLKLGPPATTASPYEAEKSMFDSSGVIPLVQLPRGWLLGRACTTGRVSRKSGWMPGPCRDVSHQASVHFFLHGGRGGGAGDGCGFYFDATRLRSHRHRAARGSALAIPRGTGRAERGNRTPHGYRREVSGHAADRRGRGRIRSRTGRGVGRIARFSGRRPA
jgi:hypothetical protein